jgi:hypothetical protein
MPEPCEAAKQSLHELVQTLGGELSSAVKTISDRYQPRFDEIRDDAPDGGGVGAALDIDIDVKWETVTVALDLPEVTMTLQEWSLDLPQVTMNDQRIVFHTPSTRMVPKKVGQYPEFVGFPPKVRWRDIIIEVPEFFMQEHVIIMGIPEVRMDRTSFKLDVPEFTMRTQELKFDVPQITVKSISVAARELKDRAEAAVDELGAEITAARHAILGSAGEKITAASSTFFTCLRTQIQMKRDEIAAAFEPGIVMVRQALSKLQSTDAAAETDEMNRRLLDLLAKRDAATAPLDAAVQSIIEQEKTTVEGLLRGLRGGV